MRKITASRHNFYRKMHFILVILNTKVVFTLGEPEGYFYTAGWYHYSSASNRADV